MTNTFWSEDIYTMAMVIGALITGGVSWLAIDMLMGGWQD